MSLRGVRGSQPISAARVAKRMNTPTRLATIGFIKGDLSGGTALVRSHTDLFRVVQFGQLRL
jgi:hypothetical protein